MWHIYFLSRFLYSIWVLLCGFYFVIYLNVDPDKMSITTTMRRVVVVNIQYFDVRMSMFVQHHHWLTYGWVDKYWCVQLGNCDGCWHRETHNGNEGEWMSTETTSMSTDLDTSSSVDSLVVVEHGKWNTTLSLSNSHRLKDTLPVSSSKFVQPPHS